MNKKRNYFTIVLAAAAILLFTIYNNVVAQSVKTSLKLCYGSVIPSLFPFFVLAEFLTSVFLATSINPTAFAFISGLISGFPTGTKNVCTLYKSNKITKQSAEALLVCTANASPAYIVAFLGTYLIKSRRIGYIILISQLISALVIALSFKSFKKTKHSNISLISIWEIATKSISGSVAGCLNVCGYIIFMGIIADIAVELKIPAFISQFLPFLPADCVKACVIGLIEISRGITALDFSNYASIICAAFIVGFSGISVIMQCVVCTYEVGLNKWQIIKGKLIYSVIMPCLTSIIIRLVPISFEKPKIVLSSMIFAVFIVFLGIFIYIGFDKAYKKLYNR